MIIVSHHHDHVQCTGNNIAINQISKREFCVAFGLDRVCEMLRKGNQNESGVSDEMSHCEVDDGWENLLWVVLVTT